MKSRTAVLAAPLSLLTIGPAAATTWDFTATECLSDAGSCTGLLTGTFSAEGAGSSTFVATDQTGSGAPRQPASGTADFSMDFGPLFRIVDGVPVPFEPGDKAVYWNIAWGPDGKPTTLEYDTEDSNLTSFHGIDNIREASDSPWMEACAGLGNCLFIGTWVDAPDASASVLEPARMWLAWPIALLGLFGFRRQWMRA